MSHKHSITKNHVYVLNRIGTQQKFLLCINVYVCLCVPVQLFFDYTADAYAKFMQGNDTFEEDDEAFITKLSKQSVYFYLFIFEIFDSFPSIFEHNVSGNQQALCVLCLT